MSRWMEACAVRTARDYLRKPAEANRALEVKRGRIQGLEAFARQLSMLVGSPNDTDNELAGRSSGRAREDAARLSEALDKLSALREELLLDVVAYAALVRQVQDLLQRCLPDTRHRAVMEAHYLGFSTWESVAEQTYYSTRHCLRLHRQALQMIGEHLCDLKTPAERAAL